MRTKSNLYNDDDVVDDDVVDDDVDDDEYDLSPRAAGCSSPTASQRGATPLQAQGLSVWCDLWVCAFF